MLQRMRIVGGARLEGEIAISGAKNLALPALAAALLTDAPVILSNVPRLCDINSMLCLLDFIGCDIAHRDAHTLEIMLKDTKCTEAPYDFVRKMRASILVLGPLVARFGHAKVSLPGGCAIGARDVDLHIKALELMGAKIELDGGYINAIAAKGLCGCDISFPIVTVTGTENVLMAAVLASGQTRIINAAMEPEVVAFCDLLNRMGAKISGQGTSVLVVDGVKTLGGAEFDISPDRIEAGTYAIAAAVTGGRIRLKNCRYDDLTVFFDTLRETGVCCERNRGDVIVSRGEHDIRPCDVNTAPYPGFPTDLQAQYCVLMSVCSGAAAVTETIFENRFMHIPELARMGATISVHGKTALITGVKKLIGAPVMATDLRASVSLILAGLIADGETIVNRIYHLDRGYETLEQKLSSCGANIQRMAGQR
ncbi:UDP-N-acetylglucosamine 1-carboxyvinyltransferase [Alphaproteobacteria bacterium]|nr:UDP-N-acetylglucosamine 1-carboxyvinyltransferase [Alphaproteobacteria bacterium]